MAVRLRCATLPRLPKEYIVHITDIIWWGYTAFLVALTLFMLLFADTVREKGD